MVRVLTLGFMAAVLLAALPAVAAQAAEDAPPPSVLHVRPPVIAAIPAPPHIAPTILIEHPEWERTPTPIDSGMYYPAAALSANVRGKAIMQCRFTRAGTLTDCAVIEEKPAGYGFGKATLALAKFFKLRRPPSEPDIPDGIGVRIPMNWTTR
jgi:protein TonB